VGTLLTGPTAPTCSPKISCGTSARNQLSGDYRGREAVYRFLGRLKELTDKTFHLDVHSVLAHDGHTVALVFGTAGRGGRTNNDAVAHVFHLRGAA
jgi:uncharacterized protein